MSLALLAVDSFDKALATFVMAKKRLGEILSAFECFDETSMELVLKHTPQTHSPFASKHAFHLLIETAGSHETHDSEKMQTFVQELMEQSVIADGILAQDQTQASYFWKLREQVSDCCQMEGGNIKFDISLPLKQFSRMVEDVKLELSQRGLYHINPSESSPITKIVGFGHVGDGNLHLNIMTRERTPELEKLVNDVVYSRVSFYNGSISAEHGLGLQKSKYLEPHLSIKWMKDLKTLFDPKGILNPYKYVDNVILEQK